MKKLVALALAACLASPLFAQTTQKNAPSSWHCVRTDIGGCVSFVVGSICSEYIYHVEICCGRPVWGTAYNACMTTTWTTANPNYRLHTGGDTEPGSKTTLEELVRRAALDNKLSPESVTGFRITDSEPFLADDGAWYQVAPDTYKIDRSVAGWALADLRFVPYKKE